MAKRTFGNIAYTPTAVADAIAITGPFQALKGGSASQRILIEEVYEAGMAAAQAPTFMMLARSIVLGITPTALAAPAYDGPMDSLTAALAAPPVSYIAAATGPQRSSGVGDGRLQLGFNAFGGIVRWVAGPNEQWMQYGSALQVGESVLSAFTGGTPGLMNSHIVYEPA
jgi:hypothetical protein